MRRATEGDRASAWESDGHADFEFNMRELAGSMGDFGTLFPLAIGFIAVNRMDPAGLFIMMGLANIALGLIYRLPMPLEPKKVVAVTAIAQEWPPSLIYNSAFGLGLVWFLLVFTGLLRKLVAITPLFLVRGIQIALAVMLGWRALEMMAPAPLLGLLAVVVAVLLRENRYAPAAVVIMALGVGIMAWRGELQQAVILEFTLPPLTLPRLDAMWEAMVLAGFAQIPLSITNAVIAAAALIRDYFPDKAVSERKLMLNMGAMNVIGSFFGGMPMCHGAQGLAGQYYFGARTGGTPILEGLIEISMGLFLSRSIANILMGFPMALIGGMMFMVAIQLGKGAVELRGWKLALAGVTAAVSVVTNMAVGFVVGLGATHLLRFLGRRERLPGSLSEMLPDEEFFSDE
ncbi:MAG: putative sulfate/molybdate transporter [Chloroflexota bacterium]